MKKLIILVLLTFSFSALANGVVKALVTLSPAGSFEATSNKVKGNLLRQGDTFTAEKLTVSVESLKTGIDMRDEHLWKHLNSNKHSRITVSNLKARGGKGTANIEVNGVTKPIQNLTYKVTGDRVEAEFNVKNSAFNLPKAQYLGVGVEDDIKVKATLPFQAK